jgi:hypothetical protein
MLQNLNAMLIAAVPAILVNAAVAPPPPPPPLPFAAARAVLIT